MDAVSCSSRSDSTAEYQKRVIDVLRAHEENEAKASMAFPGLIPSLVEPFQAMHCLEEEDCLDSTQFAELRNVSEDSKIAIADYHGRLCKPTVKPPRELEVFHTQLCKDLDEIQRSLDNIQLVAQQTLTMMSRALGSSESVAKQAAERILRKREAILTTLEDLRATEWLKAVFTNASQVIPELGQGEGP